MTQNYQKLKTLLKELFQLDQPELDFGLYRIMHAKSAEVTQFLEHDLLPQVKQAFAEHKDSEHSDLRLQLEQATAQATALGVPPESIPKVRELREALSRTSVDRTALEDDVYDHLFAFFRRYYADGDFLAKRVYKSGVYAIPYEGEEVTLHWANKDQYYIKTSEYLRDYAFRLRPNNDNDPGRVHFRLVDAAEGEHGNVKSTAANERVFVLAEKDWWELKDGELTLNFSYRPSTVADWPMDQREGKEKGPSQKELIAIAVARVLSTEDIILSKWIGTLKQHHVSPSGERSELSKLEVHLKRYCGRNTFDYFIHKDLGGFLQRELDFYLKNEVMHLDDIENEQEIDRVKQYLSKLRIIRKIAGKIIAFLAQLEEFQKKLWLKKKFVLPVEWCVSLAWVPRELWGEILANEEQKSEWVRLFAIDKIDGDLEREGFTNELTVRFLEQNPSLVVNTRHFPRSFTATLVANLGKRENGLEGCTIGTLLHGENFHALRVFSRRYHEQIKCVYIDPPYNTDDDGFAYRDSFQHSSWLSMMDNRIRETLPLMTSKAGLLCSIDSHEWVRYTTLANSIFGEEQNIETFVWKRSYGGGAKEKHAVTLHEFVVLHAKNVDEVDELWLPSVDAEVPKYYRFRDEKYSVRGPYRVQPLEAAKSLEPRPNLVFEIVTPDGQRVNPKRQWLWSKERVEAALAKDELVFTVRGDEINISYKQYLRDEAGAVRRAKPTSIIDGSFGQQGTNELIDLFGSSPFRFPKPTGLLRQLFAPLIVDDVARVTVLDYFAGSGTTGHALMELNQSHGGDRRFLLVEQGRQFDDVLVPRILKVMYSRDWKNGLPVSRSGTIGAVKILRLESYEDALNNLDLRQSPAQQAILLDSDSQGKDGLKEQYYLRYMLDVETRGSQSLLNIQAFRDPTAYKLKVKRPGGDESRDVNVDLLETFNWLLGLTVEHIAVPQTFSASFDRNAEHRLVLNGKLTQDANGPYWFRTVTGKNPEEKKVLVIWRKLTDDRERDNLVLDTWFVRQGYSTKDSEFDLIYVNGDSNLENLKTPDDRWKVRLLEEDFHRLMFDGEER